MFDFQLQMRFIISAIDAWFGYAAAGAAALEAMQADAQRRFRGESASPQLSLFDTSIANPFSWWTGSSLPSTSGAGKQPLSDFAAPFFQFGSLPFAGFTTPRPLQPWQNDWTEFLQTCCWSWPNLSWSLYQPPMTAMLMSAGLPYSVAAPTAKANMASLDAAEAARQSFDQMYSSFQTGGGHAFMPLVFWQKMLLMMLAPMATLPALQAPDRLL